MTLRELAREGEELLARAGVPEARQNARRLLLESFHITASDYILFAETELERAFPTLSAGIAMPLGLFRDRLRMRAQRIPLQQILGEASFMGLDFKVSEFTLAPRPDTEILAETVLEENRDPASRILDLCTGTGCIGISLAVLGGFRSVTLTDISQKALDVAAFNAEKLAGKESGIQVLESDLFAGLPAGSRFDVIVSNPPYIRDAVIETLEPEVRLWEPRLALSGGPDGLDFYRRIIAEAPAFAPYLCLEIGYDQAEAVTKLMQAAGYRDILVKKDLGGNDRVIRGRQTAEPVA